MKALRWLRHAVAGAALAGLLGLATGAVAADQVPTSPAQAFNLDRPYTGHLDPAAGQPFAYYKFAYPGGIVVSVDLQVGSTDPAVVGGVGFRVYGPRPGKVYLDAHAVPGIAPSASGDLVSPDPGVYLVQVYGTGAPTDFTVWASGVPRSLAPAAPDLGVPVPGVVAPGPAVAPPGAPPAQGPVAQQASVPDQAVALTDTASGQLAAGTGGHFAYYKLSYPGGTVLTINANVAPSSTGVLRSAGFKVYGPTPGKIYARSGAQPGLVPNLSADLQSAEPGVYLIQVYNYHPTASISFDIWTTGLPPATPTPTATPAPTQAAAAPAATGGAATPAATAAPSTSSTATAPDVVPPAATPTVAPTRAAPAGGAGY